MRFAFVFMLAAALLHPETASAAKPRLDVSPWPETREACEALKGTWKDTAQEPCNLPTTDAGRPCVDSIGCQGFCLRATNPEDIRRGVKGVCSDRIKLSTSDCVEIINRGKIQMICVDQPKEDA